jgi:hypothetical protein|tara:strand:+ start:280 stop:771 length:492 start_codon:yes stop_codon:yes gene_type:complete
MKKLLLLSLTILLFSCGDSDSDDNSNQTFRNIYSDSFWLIDETILTFSNDKIVTFIDDETDGCYFFEEGSYNNVNTGDCMFDNITLSIIEETSDKFVFMQVASGWYLGFDCDIDEVEVTITMEALSESLIRLTQDNESFTMVRQDNVSSFVNCQNGTLSGRLF